jgi:hypothetical protein
MSEKLYVKRIFNQKKQGTCSLVIESTVVEQQLTVPTKRKIGVE